MNAQRMPATTKWTSNGVTGELRLIGSFPLCDCLQVMEGVLCACSDSTIVAHSQRLWDRRLRSRPGGRGG